VKNFSTVTMDEVGIPAQVGAYQGPNGSDYPLTNNPLSQLVQVNWFTMACAFAKQQATPGLYFWGPIMTYNSGLLPTTTDSTYTSNLQPEGQVAIMNCFGKGTSPTLTSISPKTGSHAGGTQVTITGNNFIGTFNVFFGKTAATSFAVESNTKIVATAPAASKGVQAITVQTEAGTSAAVGASKFTFK